jgi:hypothetical protein
MSALIGIQSSAVVAANVAFTSNVTLATVGLTTAIPINANMKIVAWIPLTVGATGGVRSLVVVPAGGVLLQVTTALYNTVTPSLTTFSANTVFTSALAAAGTHWMEITAFIVNGTTAGTVDVQLAQNTTDANTLTVLRGGFMNVTRF